jgi:hypothetical protein
MKKKLTAKKPSLFDKALCVSSVWAQEAELLPLLQELPAHLKMS